MYIAAHEWRQPTAKQPVPAVLAAPQPSSCYKNLYHRLADGLPSVDDRAAAAELLAHELQEAQARSCDLPDEPQDLLAWMRANTQSVHAGYSMYLEQRKAGGPRRYFSNRAHALYFLRSVAPTKLVDGAWLYGVLPHARNPRFADLVRTYLEELGDGSIDKNHVVLYRSLVARYGLDPLDDLPDALYHQGVVQLALGWNTQAYLPEVIGFNLGYEQLPLHLLITAYELNELGLDPYYFTLHVTVDNADTGHARRACQAVLDALPRIDDGGAFWRRLREGSKLGGAGLGTVQVIEQFDIEAEVLRILAHKAIAGNGAHSDYCRVAGRSVNDWLASPQDLPGFLKALQEAGWINRGEPAANSRFWGLLQGPRAEMFGVFSDYELQVIHDWIRGEASADGQAITESPPASGSRRRPSFRAALRNCAAPATAPSSEDTLDPDLEALQQQVKTAQAGGEDVAPLLVQALSPALHWTPAGLWATRQFKQSSGV
jgi:hypothetical protein